MKKSVMYLRGKRRNAALRRSAIFVGRCVSACIAPIYDLELRRSEISNSACKDAAPTVLAGRVWGHYTGVSHLPTKILPRWGKETGEANNGNMGISHTNAHEKHPLP